MAVYFQPKNPSWWDYVMPVVGQALGGVVNNHLEGKRMDKAHQYDQQGKNADQTRKWADSDRVLNLLGVDSSKGYGTGGGAFGGLDMRGDPNGAVPLMAAIKSLVPDFEVSAVLGNLNPNMQYQAIDRGDKITAGAFNPGTGDFASQDYGVGMNPTKALESNNALAATKYTSDAGVRMESMRQTGESAREKSRQAAVNYRAGLGAGKKGPNLRTQQLEDGTIALVNPQTGEITPTGFKGPQKGGGNLNELISGMAGDERPAPKGGGFLSNIKSFFGGGSPAEAAPQLPIGQPGRPIAASSSFSPPGSAAPGPMDLVAQLVQKTGKSPGEVMAYLKGKGMY